MASQLCTYIKCLHVSTAIWGLSNGRQSRGEPMPTWYNTVVLYNKLSQGEWVTCWHDKYEILFTQIHIIPPMKRVKIEGKKQILENYGKNIVTSHETTCHFGAIAMSRALHNISWLQFHYNNSQEVISKQKDDKKARVSTFRDDSAFMQRLLFPRCHYLLHQLLQAVIISSHLTGWNI